jgi:hypothetical protein
MRIDTSTIHFTKKTAMKKHITWILLFAGIFLLSQDFLFWDGNGGLSLGGFPAWMYWFVFLQIVLVGAVYWFAKRYWK